MEYIIQLTINIQFYKNILDFIFNYGILIVRADLGDEIELPISWGNINRFLILIR